MQQPVNKGTSHRLVVSFALSVALVGHKNNAIGQFSVFDHHVNLWWTPCDHHVLIEQPTTAAMWPPCAHWTTCYCHVSALCSLESVTITWAPCVHWNMPLPPECHVFIGICYNHLSAMCSLEYATTTWAPCAHWNLLQSPERQVLTGICYYMWAPCAYWVVESSSMLHLLAILFVRGIYS